MKHIFFDLGGVLFNLNTRLSLRRFKELGVDIPDEVLLDSHPFNASADGPFISRLIHKVDSGEVDGTEFVRLVREHCPPAVTDEQVLAAYNDVVEVPRKSLQLLHDLRQQYDLYAVSNIGDLHWERVCQLIEDQGYVVDELFTRTFLSYKMHLTKPGQAYFERAIRESGVNPAETLYVDDSRKNIEAGEKAGLQTLLVKPFDLSELFLRLK